LVLVGSGPEEAQLRRLSSGDDRVIFPGYLEGAEKTSWYAAADLFVLPTLHDPWGLVVNEAMAFGLPVVVTEAAGSAELVSDNGIVVQPGEVGTLASALRKLLRTPDLRKNMGHLSRQTIASYTVEAACQAFLQVIAETCERFGADRS
jgi:glycosyltransferase involved in cell wall biosynthesis